MGNNKTLIDFLSLSSTFIIAEAGVSHFGDVEEAKRLVDIAANAACDAVKFQFFDSDELYVKSEKEWRSRLGSRQLSIDQMRVVFEYASGKGIICFATAHDIPSLRLLEQELSPPLYKIGSGEIYNHDFFEEVLSFKKPIIISTGMYSHADIQSLLSFLYENNFTDFALLHCVTSYPIPDDEVNLSAISEITSYFDGPVGYSDHSSGILACQAAVALGARIIEKHISIQFDVPNAHDWKVSASAKELIDLVQSIRRIEKFLTKSDKPSPCEKAARSWATKSIAYAKNLAAGHVLSREDLTSMRPGNGIRPDHMKNLLGRRLLAPAFEKELVHENNLDST